MSALVFAISRRLYSLLLVDNLAQTERPFSSVRWRRCPLAPNGLALGMKRHLAVVKWIETSGGEQRLCNNIFMSVMLRVGLRASGNCSNAIKAVARASAMMNWSRPVIDAELAVFGLLIAPPRQLVR